MKKGNIVDFLVRNKDFKTSVAVRAVEGVFEAMAAALAEGEDIHYRGFGTLRQVTMKAKMAHDFKTGQSFALPAKRKVAFKMCQSLKAKLNP